MNKHIYPIIAISTLLFASTGYAIEHPTSQNSISADRSDIPVPTLYENSWLTNTSYNYPISSKVNVDFGYLDLRLQDSYEEDSSNYSGYSALFGGAKYTHEVTNIGQLYASGGINLLNSHSSTQYGINTSLLTSPEITPYLAIGATIPTKIDKNLDVNFQLSYQNLQLNDTSTPSTMFTVGAQYRF